MKYETPGNYLSPTWFKSEGYFWDRIFYHFN